MDIDAQLLDRYARTRDADAFTQLVRRHAGMVFAVARRVTQNHHDAEEVAQSCFMELARQPAAIHGSLAGWLHAVATNRAIKCNRTKGLRRHYERAAARPEVLTPADWDDVAPLVDAALAELPDEIRLPMVLYHFQGRTQSEVAAELGVSQPTISHRLEEGVAALREKLKAAGVMVPGVALPALLTQHAVQVVPKTLMTMLGKLAVSGFMPAASGAASGGVSGGTAMASGTSSVAAKGTAVLGLKVMAAVVLTAAVSTAGVALLPKQLPSIAVAGTVVTLGTEAELNELVTRLKSEINQGLGNGVGILTETSTAADARLSHPEAVILFAQKGQAQLFMDYRLWKLEDYGKTMHPLPEDQIPKGWPTPPLDEVLRFADSHQTDHLKVTDGQTLWSSNYIVRRGRHISKLLSRPLGGNGIGSQIHEPAISSFFWPHTFQLIAESTKNPDVDILHIVELVHRPDNPTLVGLHLVTKQVVADNAAATFTHEDTYWLDPGRNDVPVEIDSSYLKVPAQKQKTEFLEYAQLPSGLWYPTYWRVGVVDRRFTFDPEGTLDARWFGDPTAHFLHTEWQSSPPKGLAAVTHAVAALPHAAVTATTTAAKAAWRWWPWTLAAGVFGAAGILAILQRRKNTAAAPLRGSQGPRRK